MNTAETWDSANKNNAETTDWDNFLFFEHKEPVHKELRTGSEFYAAAVCCARKPMINVITVSLHAHKRLAPCKKSAKNADFLLVRSRGLSPARLIFELIIVFLGFFVKHGRSRATVPTRFVLFTVNKLT